MAAPLTSVDLSITSGQEIVIEERSPKEVSHTRGGLGEQVAASGIHIWNPAFDVTPADIISGIITEKVSLSLSLNVGLFYYFCMTHKFVITCQGVITKKGAGAFDIKGFVLQLLENS